MIPELIDWMHGRWEKGVKDECEVLDLKYLKFDFLFTEKRGVLGLE